MTPTHTLKAPRLTPEAVQGSDLTLLRKAFESFATSSQQMEQAYRTLQQRFERISAELEKANRELERKVAELDRATRDLNHLLNSMSSGVIAVDREGKVTTFNGAAARIFELPADAILGKPYQNAFAAKGAGADGLLAILREGAEPFVQERPIVTGGGACRTIESSVSPTHDGQGRLLGAVEVFQDITELKELRERVHQADKLAALGQMAARLAHEIRNPLNGIEGFASLLERDLEPQDERRRFAQNIVRGARELNRAVTDMLSYAQDRTLQLRSTPLRAVVERAVMFVTEDLRRRGAEQIRISQRAAPEVFVLADPDELQRAVLNLLLNAVQAIGNEGRVEVAIHRDPSGGERPVVLEISDSGCGIPPEQLERLFEPFFTTKPGGTGLGLAVTRQIVERHGGHIGVRSQQQQGTTFFIRLPEAACDSHVAPSEPPRTAGNPLQ